jgi:arsenate reductase
VDYFVTPLSESKIRDLLRKMGIGARALLRAKADVYRELRLAEDRFTDGELVALMAKHPELIQRPIVEAGKRAILARPAERLREIL